MYSIKQTPCDKDPIELDIHFQEPLNSMGVTHVVTELFKSLLFQRHQIPQTVDALRRDVETFNSPGNQENDGSESALNPTLGPREAAKKKRSQVKRNKLRGRYIKKAQSFLDSFDRIVEVLTSTILCLEGEEIECVAFIMGATHVSPKEIYRVLLPSGYTRLGCCPKASMDKTVGGMNKRAMLQLFRTVMTHEDLYQRISKDLCITNTFVAMCRRGSSVPNSPNLELRSEMAYVPPRKCKVTVFALKHTLEMQARRIPPKVSGRDCYTPAAMDMCTPFVDRSNTRQRADSTCHNSSITMLETPCHPIRNVVESSGTPLPKPTMDDIVEETGHLMSDVCLEEEEEQQRDLQWLFVQHLLKGFRDPQVES